MQALDPFQYVIAARTQNACLWQIAQKAKNIFFYFFTELKTYHFFYPIYKNDAIDIADPSSMQDACHTLTLKWALGSHNFFFGPR